MLAEQKHSKEDGKQGHMKHKGYEITRHWFVSKKYYEVLTNCYEKSKLSASHGTETHFE